MKMRKLLNLLFLTLATGMPLQAQIFPEDGVVYRLVNTFRENAILSEDYGANTLHCKAKKDGDYSQLWMFVKSGEGWNIQNGNDKNLNCCYQNHSAGGWP